jgi:hypothetical protein
MAAALIKLSGRVIKPPVINIIDKGEVEVSNPAGCLENSLVNTLNSLSLDLVFAISVVMK